MNILDLLILALATMYLAEVITGTDGPFGVFRALRDKTRKRLGGMLECIKCTGFWVALILGAIWLLVPFGTYLVTALAIVGGALALRSYSGVAHG